MKSSVNFNPLIYHHHHAEKTEDIPFWIDLAKEASGQILELGCGTGRAISHLAQLGQRVVGLDLDFGMLAFLKNNLPIDLWGEVDIFQANLGCFHLEQKFSLILLACNTLSTLDSDTREQAFTQVQRHLTDGGLFATSIPNPMRLERLPVIGDPEVEDIISHPVSGNPLQVSSEWKRADQYLVFRWHYDHLIPDGHVDRYTIEIRHTLTNLQEYREEMRAAKLNTVEIFGDFDRSNYNQDSPFLILTAKRGSKF